MSFSLIVHVNDKNYYLCYYYLFIIEWEQTNKSVPSVTRPREGFIKR